MDTLTVFEAACRAAGAISLPAQKGIRSKKIGVDKGGGDFATEADINSGAEMTRILSEHLPEIEIVSEENKTGSPDEKFQAWRQKILDGGTYILMDDLDATVRYTHGGEDYGHMLGLVENNVLTHCATYMPKRGVMVTAKKWHGCTITEDGPDGGAAHSYPPKLDQTATLADGMLYAVVHKDLPRRFHDDVISELVYQTNPSGFVCFNSNIAGSVRLLQGEIVGFIGTGHNWDFTPAIAIQEAGGIAVSPNGMPLTWSNIPMIMVAGANQKIVDELLTVTKKYPAYQEDFGANPKFQN